MTPQDTRPRHIHQGTRPAEPLTQVSMPLSWDLVEYIIEIEQPMGFGMSVKSPVVVSYRQACETSIVAPSEQVTQLSITSKGIVLGERGALRLSWDKPFSMVLSTWLLDHEMAELYVKLHPRGELSAKKGLGFSVIWPQRHLCAQIPLKEERLPYLKPEGFRQIWPLLLTYAGVHGFEDRPWVGETP